MPMTAELPASITNLANPTVYVSCADTAKLVRKALREAFPEVKFSVRSSTYSGGASIDVRWAEGPLTAEVEAIAKVFAGGRFDGMIDLKNHVTHVIDGQATRFCADYVFCTRELDETKVSALAEVFARAALVPFDKNETWPALAAKYGLGQQALRWLSYHPDAHEFARYLLQALPDPKFRGRRSPTAERYGLLSAD